MQEIDESQPFGTYRPTPLQAWAHGRAQRLRRRDWIGFQLQTSLFKLAGGKIPGAVYDVPVFGTEKARLHPTGNICEKRCYSASQFWDDEERAFLAAALFDKNHPDTPLFLDIGSNVGLYGLALHAAARARNEDFRILAVEPDPTLRSRLNFNYEASGVQDWSVEAVAITPEDGPVSFAIDEENRGRNAIGGNTDGMSVEGVTLPSLLAGHGITRIDAMKIDIEGHEIAALTPLFAQAERSLWPKVICVEIDDERNASPAAFCEDNGYIREGETKMNALLRLPD
ncbi:MAG: FkbM family methyltransferase [Pseudomonadota bacterium]